jgi:hypothetical protein
MPLKRRRIRYRRFPMKKVPRALEYAGLCQLDAERLGFGLKLSHSKDFIPIPATLGAVKPLKTCLRNYPSLSSSSYVGQVTAQMALPQPIAYDKIFIHEKTKVIRLQGHPAG